MGALIVFQFETTEQLDTLRRWMREEYTEIERLGIRRHQAGDGEYDELTITERKRTDRYARKLRERIEGTGANSQPEAKPVIDITSSAVQDISRASNRGDRFDSPELRAWRESRRSRRANGEWEDSNS